jgi:hypothetical protein
MVDRAFIIQQVGAKDSSERKRADEIYDYIIVPALKGAGLEPYRADLDLSPGAITTKMLSELLSARIVIADLTGRNPNVFYEHGITHSFARPLISLADSSRTLPFDAKNERIIELGDYLPSGLTFVQGERAKAALEESLRIILNDDYIPPSPLREVAANRSVDELAPENPIAAEMAHMREALDEIRNRVTARGAATSGAAQKTIDALRAVIERKVGLLDEEDFKILSGVSLTSAQNNWVKELRTRWQMNDAVQLEGPWANDTVIDSRKDALSKVLPISVPPSSQAG